MIFDTLICQVIPQTGLLSFLVWRVLFAMLAELSHLETIFENLFVLARKIVNALALFAFKLDHCVL